MLAPEAPCNQGSWPGSQPSCPAILLVYPVTEAFSNYSEDHFALETPAVPLGAAVTDAKALNSKGLAGHLQVCMDIP